MTQDVFDASPFCFGPDPFPDTDAARFGPTNKHNDCFVCELRGYPGLKHRHHSTQFYRLQLETNNSSEMKCDTCKIKHPITTDSSPLIILITSSTLHNVQRNPEVRIPFHLDVESICGASTEDLLLAWRAAYSNVSAPTHTVVLAGLNDIKDKDVKNFERDLSLWSLAISLQHKDSTVRFCKLPRPPMYSWFPCNSYPLPKSPFINYLDKINQMNAAIVKRNMLNGFQDVIGFSMEGCRAGRSRSVRHNLAAWREFVLGETHCLHLNEPNRVRMLKKLVRYILHKIWLKALSS